MGIGNIATTGMKAAMTDMEVISNNISNAGTPAFKASHTNFADIYPTNASTVQAGLGVAVTGIQQSFTPGGPTATGLASDLCIMNNGFFVMRDASSSQLSYTRYGGFALSNDGYFTLGNQHLQGYAAVNNTIPSGSPISDLFVNTSPIPAAASTTVSQQNLNLNAADGVKTIPFDPNDQSSFNYSSVATVYDSLGTENHLNLYYLKTSANEWTVNAYMNGASIGTGSLTFSSDGSLATSVGLDALSFNPTSGATSPQVFEVDMAGATQFSAAYNTNPFSSDGYSAGTYSGYTIDKNGEVSVQYSNKQNVLVGKIALATFRSPEGLQNIGNMSWIETDASGTPNVAQTNSEAAIQQGSLEMANVDLASEMVKLITVQNIFQANAQVEQTYNEVMQTVTQL